MTLATTQQPRLPRLDGLDLARYLALAGMVLVNFRLAMQPASQGLAWLEALFSLLEGKASATFVVLAGLGLILATNSKEPHMARAWISRRSLFLLGTGMLNLLIFPADIIHYYAVYFLLALPLLRAKPVVLATVMLVVAAVSTWDLLHTNYNEGWDWTALHYRDLWTPTGFARNLLFNGFHPVLPWFVLFLYGMLLAHLPLQRASTQWTLVAAGSMTAMLAALISHLCQKNALAWLLGTAPMPPGPLYVLMGIGSASVTIGICLRLTSLLPGWPWRFVLPAGRMTLSLYLAHIVIGMGLLEAFGALNGSCSLTETTLAAVSFLAIATVSAWIWSCKMKQGPIEGLMRRLTALR